jgi:hypothetical protein
MGNGARETLIVGRRACSGALLALLPGYAHVSNSGICFAGSALLVAGRPDRLNPGRQAHM